MASFPGEGVVVRAAFVFQGERSASVGKPVILKSKRNGRDAVREHVVHACTQFYVLPKEDAFGYLSEVTVLRINTVRERRMDDHGTAALEVLCRRC
jgi:hypothetical protein